MKEGEIKIKSTSQTQ